MKYVYNKSNPNFQTFMDIHKFPGKQIMACVNGKNKIISQAIDNFRMSLLKRV